MDFWGFVILAVAGLSMGSKEFVAESGESQRWQIHELRLIDSTFIRKHSWYSKTVRMLNWASSYDCLTPNTKNKYH